MLEINKIHNQDCRDGLKLIESDTCALAISSPPYKNEDSYSDCLMVDTFNQIYRVLKTKSLFFLNFGSLAEDKFRPFNVCKLAVESGFQLNDTIVWVKNHYKPIQGKKRLNNLSEFVFLLYKDEMPELNRLAIGIPYVDSSNAKRFNNGQNLKCRGNVWHINYETINSKEEKLHNDRFPLELPKLCIKLSDIKDGEIVIDPFVGSGTTCLAAKQLNKSYLGFDLNPEYVKISQERLK